MRHACSLTSVVTTLALGLSACAVDRRPTAVAWPPVELPPTTLSADQQVSHVLNRLAFGPSTADANDVRSMGPGAWIARQLRPEAINDARVDAELARFPTLTMTIAQAEEAFPPLKVQAQLAGIDMSNPDMKEQLRQQIGKDELPRRIGMELASAKLIRAVESRRQLQEVLVDFWFNHFNVSAEKGAVKWMISSYERDAIRPFVFGRFRDLLGATAHHPAMLFYLDNWMSVRDGFELPRNRKALVAQANGANPAGFQMPKGLNENYGRELLELHTMGVNGGYTQDDVREVARAFTGWSIEKPQKQGEFRYRPFAHDNGPKVVLGQELPAGGGPNDGERVLDLLARHPATARFIATKLCRKFVADDPPPALVERVADVFLKSDGDLRQVYLAIFTSPEMWSSESFAKMTKTPFEFAVSAVRAMNASYDGDLSLYRQIERMGEPLYRSQPPTGFPEQGDAWVNAGALVTRINFGIQLAANRLKGARVDGGRVVPLGRDGDAMIDAVALELLQRPLSPVTRATIQQALSGDELPDGERRRADPRLIAGLVLGSPEFQKQ